MHRCIEFVSKVLRSLPTTALREVRLGLSWLTDSNWKVQGYGRRRRSGELEEFRLWRILDDALVELTALHSIRRDETKECANRLRTSRLQVVWLLNINFDGRQRGVSSGGLKRRWWLGCRGDKEVRSREREREKERVISIIRGYLSDFNTSGLLTFEDDMCM
ncbi:hypothetical protein BDY19DRAFT_746085 [Irpex rosettiformis]|uniref:Uncharacterized protein n=1 Tax=Irpex rosettiformis TaxID=378272 RepID=A0ACB8TMD9_9APHY|nr:hypothetical protein BDY19DRAFT_746085 [Irpex rosettiformis]